MQVHFLGTGTSQGIPIIGSDHPVCLSTNTKDKRLRSSIAIEVDGQQLVIDCGPDFRYQMLRAEICCIDAILFTHEHADHTAGLDDIRPFYFKQGNIPMYGHQRVLDNLAKRFDYIFSTENKYPGAPSVETFAIKNEDFLIGKTKVTPISVMHHKLQVFGFRIRDFAYLTDVKTVSDEEMLKLQGIDTLVINALRLEPHPSHFNLDEALTFVDKIKPKRAYFTHISHLLGFHDEVEEKLPNHVHLAYDGLIIQL
ncbi:MAG: MBL fold metallo-hydrolase [Flavobacteriaceae bacterium]|nr:MBL fold metallo-hydrolase [Flavobacteriaceae bacterium]